ncbi:MAG TPA: YdaS family helix-turn-helix protein [Rhizomicrobium sp.]|nr:YdaS family helix-turn-helix protein [Rhizomicrobium sp.]
MMKNAMLLPCVARAAAMVGGVRPLGAKLGVKPTTFYHWGRVPGKRVLAIEKITSGQITRHDLRPDLYPLTHKPVDEQAVRRIIREEMIDLVRQVTAGITMEISKGHK